MDTDTSQDRLPEPVEREAAGWTPDRWRAVGWDHRASLRAAWSELRRAPLHEAIPRIRAAVGSDHATLALLWARLVDAAIARCGPGADLESFLGANPGLRRAELTFLHYSPERIASPRSRREFVLPDRAPLPAPPVGRAPDGAQVGNRSDRRKDPAGSSTDPAR